MRRRHLIRLLGVVAASLAGCGGRGAPLDVPDATAVGEPLPVAVPDADGPRTVSVTATDARGVAYVGRLRVDGDGVVRRVVGESSAPGTAIERSEASSSAVRSAGLADDQLRMPLHRLTQEGGASPSSFVAWTAGDTDADVELELSAGGATATTTRTVASPTVTARTLDADGVTGRLFEPPGTGPHRGVLLLHGSAGRIPERYARLLATHGVVVLAPLYFGTPGLPDSLDGVPLSSIERALDRLRGRDDVRAGRIGLVGLSRGVEPALLTAAAHDGPTAVVGYLGSGLVSVGLGPDGRQAGAESAWTRDGEPVAAAEAVRSVYWALQAADADRVERVRAADGVDEVAIPVEAIDGPVALFSGGRDALWDATVRSEYAVRRLARHGHDHPFCHVRYPEAGHVFHVPYVDFSTVSGPELGGMPAANATAAADSWLRALDYLLG